MTSSSPRPPAGFPPAFYRATAAASASAVLLVLAAQLLLVPEPPEPGDGRLARLYLDPVFRAQGLVILVQVGLMFVALWGVVAAGWDRSPAWMGTALLFLVLWQVLELVPRAVDLFAAGGVWAPAWSSASTDAQRATALAALEAWQPVWSALGVGRRIVWGTAHLLLGLGLVRATGFARACAFLFLFNAARLLPRTLGEIAGAAWLSGLTGGRGWFLAGTLPLFALVTVWLWRQGGAESTGSAAARP